MAEKCRYLGPQGDCRAPAIISREEAKDSRTRGIFMKPREMGGRSTRGSQFGCLDCNAVDSPVRQAICQDEHDIVLEAAREGRIFRATGE